MTIKSVLKLFTIAQYWCRKTTEFGRAVVDTVQPAAIYPQPSIEKMCLDWSVQIHVGRCMNHASRCLRSAAELWNPLSVQEFDHNNDDDDDDELQMNYERVTAKIQQQTCANKLAVTLVFRLDEVREDVFVRPAVSAVRRPFIIVMTVASHVQHVIYVAWATQTLPRVPHAHLF